MTSSAHSSKVSDSVMLLSMYCPRARVNERSYNRQVYEKLEYSMNLDRVSSGRDVPNDFNVIIEIPAHGEPIKYEVDKDTGAMFVDRFMSTAMHYPCNYGYVPHTLSDDGDPVDVLVITPIPLLTGVVVRCRPVGMLKMQDEAGDDAKVLAVPVDKLTSLYRDIESPRDLPEMVLSQISHFFEHYKDLEAGKWVKVQGWVGAEEAKAEILAGVQRYQAAPEKPHF
jgi:inorganic pyrophosphatase